MTFAPRRLRFWPHAALYVGRIADLRNLGIVDEDAVKENLEEYLKLAPDGHDHTVIEIVRKSAQERRQPNPQLDLVLFLDGDRTTGVARNASADEYCESAKRPGAFDE